MPNKVYKCAIETKKKLQNAVLKLVPEKGYDKITIRDICEEAKVSIGSFYHQFQSKEDVTKSAYYTLEHVINSETEQIVANLSAIDGLNFLLESLMNYIDGISAPIMRDYYKLILKDTQFAVFNPDRPYFECIKKQVLLCQEQNFLVAKDPVFITEYLLRYQRGLIFDWCFQNCTYSLTQKLHEELPLLLDGILSSSDVNKT